MDTSETYIKQCEKAEEIQENWQPSVGDWFLHDYHGTTPLGKELEDKIWVDQKQWERIECLTYKPSIDDFIEVSTPDGSHGVYTSSSLLKDRHIWLPRQEQLQEMVGNGKEYWKILQDFLLFFSGSIEIQAVAAIKRWTGEQLWLAFVMKEKYGKIWLNGVWVTEKEYAHSR